MFFFFFFFFFFFLGGGGGVGGGCFFCFFLEIFILKNLLEVSLSKYMFKVNIDNSGFYINLGPVVQSIVSLTSSLAVKLLSALVSTISNSQVFLLKKCE